MITRQSQRRLIPQILAGLLFCGGCWFALLALPFTVILALDPDGWRACAYFIFGYLVYVGWFWRAWHTPSARFVISLWLLSIVQNSLVWIFILHEEHWHFPALHGFQTYGTIPGFGFIIFGWWLVASILSVIALIFEFLPRSHDA